MARLLTWLVDIQSVWAKPFGDFNHRWLSTILNPLGPIKSLLHGTWLGHPLHAALTDVPIGALTVTVVLDLINQRAGADVALVVGILSMVASAVVGAADYVDTDGTARTRATVHGTLMVVALVVYLVSLALRTGDPVDRTVPVVLSVVGYLLITAGAYVGGDVVYVLGNMVSRHAFRSGGTKWVPVDLPDEIPEGTLIKATAGQNPLVVVRFGDTIQALHETCAHAGGPLSKGEIVDGCVQCPWHQSRFRLSNGHVVRGPAVYDQPVYEIRRTEAGAWEARRAPKTS